MTQLSLTSISQLQQHSLNPRARKVAKSGGFPDFGTSRIENVWWNASSSTGRGSTLDGSIGSNTDAQCLEMLVYDHKTLGDRWARTESQSACTWVVWPARVTSLRGSAYTRFYSSDWTILTTKYLNYRISFASYHTMHLKIGATSKNESISNIQSIILN